MSRLQCLGPYVLLFVGVACVAVAAFAPDPARAKDLNQIGIALVGAAVMGIVPHGSRTIIGGERSGDTGRQRTIEQPKGGQVG